MYGVLLYAVKSAHARALSLSHTHARVRVHTHTHTHTHTHMPTLTYILNWTRQCAHKRHHTGTGWEGVE